jgi:4-amino-4-deoxy-L-arabinose transferase-like glycosyltransferase
MRPLLPFLLLLLSALSLFSFAPDCGLIYDGGMYAGIASSLLEEGRYAYNGVVGDLPPVFPLLLTGALAVGGEDGIHFTVPLSALLLILALYSLLATRFEPSFAFLGALLLLFHPAVFEYSITVVRDIPLLLTLTLAYLLYERSLARERLSPREGLALGGLTALSFLNSYPALLYLSPLYLHAALRKRGVLLPVLTLSIFVVPWALWSWRNHGTPFVEHSAYLVRQIDPLAHLDSFLGSTLPVYVTSFRFPLLLALGGIVAEGREKGLRSLLGNRYFQLLCLVLLPNAVWPDQTIRYLFPSLIAVLIFALSGITRLKRRRLAILLLFLILAFQIPKTLDLAESVCPRFTLLEDAGRWLGEHTPEDASLMAASYYQISYFSDRRTYAFPRDPREVDRFLEEKGVLYVVIDSYEKTLPSYARDHFRRYPRVKTFRDSRGEVEIYRIPGP